MDHSAADEERKAPPVEPLAYDIATACKLDGIGRSTHYLAIQPDPARRGGLPFLRTFKVGARRLMLATDHQAWIEELSAASATEPKAA